MERINHHTLTFNRLHYRSRSGLHRQYQTRKLQGVHIVKPVLQYLEHQHEQYVLRCIQVGS